MVVSFRFSLDFSYEFGSVVYLVRVVCLERFVPCVFRPAYAGGLLLLGPVLPERSEGGLLFLSISSSRAGLAGPCVSRRFARVPSASWFDLSGSPLRRLRASRARSGSRPVLGVPNASCRVSCLPRGRSVGLSGWRPSPAFAVLRRPGVPDRRLQCVAMCWSSALINTPLFPPPLSVGVSSAFPRCLVFWCPPWVSRRVRSFAPLCDASFAKLCEAMLASVFRRLSVSRMPCPALRFRRWVFSP